MKGGDSIAILQAGLPNITGGLRALYFTAGEGAYYGAIYGANMGSVFGIGSSNVVDCQAHFNAGLSSAIYGASDTVQPPAIVLIPQIKF